MVVVEEEDDDEVVVAGAGTGGPFVTFVVARHGGDGAGQGLLAVSLLRLVQLVGHALQLHRLLQQLLRKASRLHRLHLQRVAGVGQPRVRDLERSIDADTGAADSTAPHHTASERAIERRVKSSKPAGRLSCVQVPVRADARIRCCGSFCDRGR